MMYVVQMKFTLVDDVCDVDEVDVDEVDVDAKNVRDVCVCVCVDEVKA